MTSPADAAEPLLTVEGLSVELQLVPKPRRVVDDVSLFLGRGEVLALVGESGSGKSLTARAIMGLLPAGMRVGNGRIVLAGGDLTRLDPQAYDQVRGRQIGMLFQQPQTMLDPTCRVGDQVTEALRKHRGVSAAVARERAIALLRDVGVPDPERRARAYAHELSVGMAQRVMLAAALSADPDLLIADEPTTALDVTVQAQILRLLDAERRKRNMAVLLISHDLTVVAAVASRVAVMYAGRIVEEGPTATLIQAPRHPYTRMLFAAAELDPESRPGQEAAIGDFGSTVAVARGCRYLPRCRVAVPAGLAATCASDEPSLLPFGAGAAVRCWASQPR